MTTCLSLWELELCGMRFAAFSMDTRIASGSKYLMAPCLSVCLPETYCVISLLRSSQLVSRLVALCRGLSPTVQSNR
jgi:hypothetical protein